MAPIIASPGNIFEDVLAPLGIFAYLIFVLGYILAKWWREFRNRRAVTKGKLRPPDAP